MATFTLMCSCGDVQAVHADSHAEAVAILQKRWDMRAYRKHLREKHHDEHDVTRIQINDMIEGKLMPTT